MTTDARLLSARRGAALRPFLDDTLSALDVRGDGRSSTTWVPRHTAGVVVGDVVALGIALLAALIVSLRLTGGWEPSTPWVLGGVATLWLAALAGSGGYNRYHCGTGSEEYRAIGRAAVVTLAVVSAAALIADSRDARTVLLPFVAVAFVGTLANHAVMRQRLAWLRQRSSHLMDTIVVGREDRVAAMIREFHAAPQAGFRVVGACVPAATTGRGPVTIEGVPVVGTPGSAISAVDQLGCDVVAVSSDADLAGAPLRRLGWSLAERKIDLLVSPGIVEVAGPRLSLRPAAGLSMLHVERPADGTARLLLKRSTDTVGAGCIVLLALPVLAAIFVAVRLGDGGPAFFLQERVGQGGRTFRMIKFRTMVTDAEARLAQLSREGHVNTMLFKDKSDPRITRVGRILRKYSLDELPQLLNVLKGDMSLVGPRPPLAREVADYESDAMQRLRVLPGMTGLWQISGRSDLDWEQSLRLDLWYVDNWTPMLDWQILARTAKAVVRASGAY